VPPERVLVVTTADQVAQVTEVLPAASAAQPAGRARGAQHRPVRGARRARDPPPLARLGADRAAGGPRHPPRESFQRTLRAARARANQSGALIVCGIQPTFPATGFGYIQVAEIARQVDGQFGVPRAALRREARRARAQSFLAEGGYYWNAGIFVWHTRAILRAIERWMPETHAALIGATRGVDIGEIYRSLPKVSIDVGVLERASGVRMIPIDYFWSDVGSWSSLAEVDRGPAQAGNRVSGGAELVAEESSGCIVHAAEGEVVALARRERPDRGARRQGDRSSWPRGPRPGRASHRRAPEDRGAGLPLVSMPGRTLVATRARRGRHAGAGPRRQAHRLCLRRRAGHHGHAARDVSRAGRFLRAARARGELCAERDVERLLVRAAAARRREREPALRRGARASPSGCARASQSSTSC
jgi:mannose-1-phosphate guanylyltransferase